MIKQILALGGMSIGMSLMLFPAAAQQSPTTRAPAKKCGRRPKPRGESPTCRVSGPSTI